MCLLTPSLYVCCAQFSVQGSDVLSARRLQSLLMCELQNLSVMTLGKDEVPAWTVNFLTSDQNQMLGTVIIWSFVGEYGNALFHNLMGIVK